MKIHRAVLLLTVGVLGAASGGAVGWLVPDTSAAAPEVEICADSDIPAVVSERVAQVASSLSVEHRRGRCSDPAPMVLRAGYNPNQPELSVSTDRIRRVKAGTPTTRKVVVRAVSLDERSDAFAEATGFVVASAFTCWGDSCFPSEYEVYVRPTDTPEQVDLRVRRAAALTLPQ